MLRSTAVKARIGALAVTIWATATLAGRCAGAQEPPAQLWQIRLDAGLSSPTPHLHETGEVGLPPPGYGALTVERLLTSRVAIDASAAVVLLAGPAYGLAARFAFIRTHDIRVSVGAGPLLVDDEDFSSGSQLIMFAQVDLTGEVRFESGFLAAAGVQGAFALQSAGSSQCALGDTCNAWAEPGDRIITWRLGVGWAL
jgi:hypothetical protein